MRAKLWLRIQLGGVLLVLSLAGCPETADTLSPDDPVAGTPTNPNPGPGDATNPSDQNPRQNPAPNPDPIPNPPANNPNPPPLDTPPAPDPANLNDLPNNPADPPAADTGASFIPTYGTSAAIVQNATTYLTLGVEAAIRASVLANGGSALVTTGTLTQTAPNTLDFTYAPDPQDRLHVVLTNGTAADFFITTLNGDFSADGKNFLNNPHEARLRVIDGDQMDLEFYSLQNQGVRRAAAKGSFAQNGKNYTTDLQADGTYYFETDSTGSHYENHMRYAGTINTDGLALQVDEAWDYTSVYARGSFEASTSRRTLNSAWTTAAGRYRYDNAVVKGVFRDGKPNNLDTEWFIGGALLKDDAPFGRLEMGGDAVNVKAYLVLPAERVELQAWRH